MPTAKAVKARAYREKRKVDLTAEDLAEARRKNRSPGGALRSLHAWSEGISSPVSSCAGCVSRLTKLACCMGEQGTAEALPRQEEG